MIDYFVTNSEGLIIKYGVCVLEEDLPKDENIYLEKCQVNATHYINGEFLTIVDKTKLEAEALRLRDTYLSNGPDRISPLWWSSMTEQEQQAWTFYRQALLDITEQSEYPEFIVWPIKP